MVATGRTFAGMKTQARILEKLGIARLNKMQEETRKAVLHHGEIVVLSPTGTGKTLAFLLPVVERLKPGLGEVQALIVVPSRELAVQIETVARQMGSGYKINAFYGGRPGAKDRAELKTPPAILIGTPGRLADHFSRGTVRTQHVRTLILDEFDKSLEVGFEAEMKEIMRGLPNLDRKLLSSATRLDNPPGYLKLRDPLVIDHLGTRSSKLTVKVVPSPEKDKLDALYGLLAHTGTGSGIVFCNFKATVEYVGDYLSERGVPYAEFHGDLEQLERERNLVKFRNGSNRFLLATDLAARGIDVPELDFIVHYQLPAQPAEFTHRNGRTARMHASGTAYVLHWAEAPLPDYLADSETLALPDRADKVQRGDWKTLHVSAGRKDKLSKGDVAGLFFKVGELDKGELGVIELNRDAAYVGVVKGKAAAVARRLNNQKVKGRKVRVSVLN